jgi:hypothetical protein
MDHRMTRGLLIALFVLTSACGGARFHMRPAASAALQAPSEGHALVVFAMPQGRTVITVLDQYGVYFGQLRGGSFFTREVDPGLHRFYAVRNVSGHVVHTEALEAGRTYYVLAEDPFAAPFRLRPLGCDEDGAAAIAALSRVEPDPSVSESSIRDAIGDEPMRMHEADQRWVRLTSDEQARATLASCAAAVRSLPTSETGVASEPAETVPATGAP